MDQLHPLKAFRERQTPPLSQQQLADLIGVSRVCVTRWESGERKPAPEDLPRITAETGIEAAALRPDLAELFGKNLRARGLAGPRRSRARKPVAA
jgi:transcriptional regulator with XRE-family HTH domain